eukprot:2506393-Prymnesium_polylepis.1
MPSHDCISVRPYGLSVIVNSSSPGRSMSMSRHQSCQSLRSRQPASEHGAHGACMMRGSTSMVRESTNVMRESTNVMRKSTNMMR